MLQKEPLNRITTERILKSKWFAGLQSEQTTKLSSDVLNNMMKYKGASMLKRAAMNLLVKQLNPKLLEDLHDQFVALDKDKSGLLSQEEITEALKNQGLNFNSDDVTKMI